MRSLFQFISLVFLLFCSIDLFAQQTVEIDGVVITNDLIVNDTFPIFTAQLSQDQIISDFVLKPWTTQGCCFFNGVTGWFKAPKSGFYHFSANATISELEGHTYDFFFRKFDGEISTIHHKVSFTPSGFPDFFAASISGVVYLFMNEEIGLVLTSADPFDNVHVCLLYTSPSPRD